MMTDSGEKERQRVWHRLDKAFKKAMGRFSVIDDGDKILVGLSGGKDSLLLLEMLAKRSKIIKPRFEVEAIHVRMANVKYETSTAYLERFCRNMGVRLHIVTTSFDETVPTHKPKCFLCSWYRRKEMFNLAQQLGCNKIALGHHNDDIIHTALMNTIFQGHFSTMPVVLKMKKMPLTIIRPLCYCEENDIRAYAELSDYEKQVKLCPYEHDSHRTSIRLLYDQLEKMAPEARYSIWNALETEGKLVEE